MDTSKFTGTLSSNGKQNTTQANQLFTFTEGAGNVQTPVRFLTVDAFATSLHIQINDEATVHEIDPSTSMTFEDIYIYKFTIQENGAQYRWTALY